MRLFFDRDAIDCYEFKKCACTKTQGAKMKNSFRVLMFFLCIIVLSISSRVFAGPTDIVTRFSENIIKVDLMDDGHRIRFSYCEDKKQLDKCELLGRGQYLVDDIKTFKTIQGIKLAGNGIGAVVGMVLGGVGFAAGAVGATTLVFAPAGLAVSGVSLGVIVGSVELAKFAVSNIENLYVLSGGLLDDELVDYSEDFSSKLKKYSKDTFENREAKKKLLLERNTYNKKFIKTTAVEIEKILLRLDVSVEEV